MYSDESNVIRKGTDELIFELKPIHPSRLRGSAGSETWSVTFSPDGSHFAWSMGYGVVKVLVWPLPNDEDEHSKNTEEKTLNCGDTVWGLAFGPRPSKRADMNKNEKGSENSQKLLLATGLNNGMIKIWVVSTGHLLFDLKGHQSVVRDLVFTPDGNLTLVSASRDRTLRIWDLTKNGQKPHVLTGPTGWVFSCSVSPDSSMIASVCSSDCKVYLWSLRSYTFIRNLTCDRFGGRSTMRMMMSCDFSPDGALLTVGSYGSTGWRVDLWDPYTAEHLAKLEDCDVCAQKESSNLIKALRFSPECLLLAFVTDDRELRIWELGQDKFEMESEPVGINNGLCCTFHPQGGIIATGTRDGHVKFWGVPRLVPSLCHLCRTALRFSTSTHQVQALPLPKKILDFLTYRNIPKSKVARCNHHYSLDTTTDKNAQ